jgi:general L-amino acid transport system substrate-binding protein
MRQRLTTFVLLFRAAILLIAALLLSNAPALAQDSGSATLDAVRARGQLLCGTGGEIPGFSMLDSNGVMRGLDADYCRAIAAAVLGDATKVKWVPVTAQAGR